MTPPKVLGAPKPQSSVMINSTFGAPLGGATRGGHHGFDWAAFRLITPPNAGGCGGRYLPSSVRVAAADPGAGVAGCCAIAAVAPAIAIESTTLKERSKKRRMDRETGTTFDSFRKRQTGATRNALQLLRSVRPRTAQGACHRVEPPANADALKCNPLWSRSSNPDVPTCGSIYRPPGELSLLPAAGFSSRTSSQ